LKLAFDSQGDGPLAVLLHGFPEYRITWRRQLPVLAAAGFRAIAPDLRGYGESPKPSAIDEYQLPKLVEDVAELIDEPCVLIGHDWGALVAWFLAMTKPELVKKLVIINVPHPALFVRELRRSPKQKLLASYQLFFQLPVLPELFMRVFGRMLMKRAGRFSPEQIDAYAAHWKRNIRTMLHYYRAMRKTRGALRPMMRRIDVPTLIIWGEREPVMLPSTLEGTEEWVPDVRIVKVARAGHFAQHDQTEKVNELLLEFLATPPTAPSPR
jgi:epoxide hydrolase 4